MGEGHLPVLVDEVVTSLAVGAGSSVADCTVGGGGHAERLLEATSPDGRLLGIDADRAAIAEAERVLARFGTGSSCVQANFESIYDTAIDAGVVPLDGDPLRPGTQQLSARRSRARIQLCGRRAAGYEIR